MEHCHKYYVIILKQNLHQIQCQNLDTSVHLPLTSSHDPTTFFLKLAVRNLVSKEEEITGIITIYFGRRTLPKLANFLQENLMPFFTNYHSFFTTFSIFYFSSVHKNKKVSSRAKYNIVQSAGSAFYVFQPFPLLTGTKNI